MLHSLGNLLFFMFSSKISYFCKEKKITLNSYCDKEELTYMIFVKNFDRKHIVHM